MKDLQSWVRNIFGFTETEARGFWILSLLMLIFILLPVIYRQLPAVTSKKLMEEDRELDSLVATMKIPEHGKIENFLESPKTHKIIASFRFDPNIATEAEFVRLGLKTKTIRTLLHFRQKGGKFRTKKDLLKIYGMDQQLFTRLERFIELPDTTNRLAIAVRISNKVYSKSDINTADTSDLQKLRGIGSKLSSRILKYREVLGGFTDTAQFREIYGLDSSTVALLNKHFFISSQYHPKRIKINFLTVEALSKHPYLGKKLANIIGNYRAQHQSINSYQEFANIHGVPEATKERLKPYLDFGSEEPANNIEDQRKQGAQ